MNERIKKVRKALNLTQQEFANRIGIARGNVAAYEVKKNAPSDAVIALICREFNINEAWLRSGEGEMFIELLPEDEIARYVSDLLEDDGSNPLYKIIKEIMRTYAELSPKSQEVLREACAKLLENLQREKEG